MSKRYRLTFFGATIALGLAMAGRLLRSGTLLLLDSPLYLTGPRPRLSPSFWGFAPAPTNGAPVEVFLLWLFKLVPLGQARLVFFLALPPLAAWGFSRIFGRDLLPTLAATFLYAVNPFMYERMLAGHLYLVLGFALLPLLLSCLLEVRLPRSAAVKVGLLLATLVAVSLHFVFVAGLLVLAIVGVALVDRKFTTAAVGAMGLLATTALSLYWLIPLLTTSVPVSPASQLDRAFFQTAADTRFGLIPNVLGLQGFWGTRWPLPSNTVSWPQLLAAILLIVGFGLVHLARDRSRRVLIGGLAAAGLVGTLLALGEQGPTGSIFLWMFRTVPGFGAMREPQKFLGLLALTYAVGFGWGVKVLLAQARTRAGAALALVILLAVPAVYGFRSFGGFVGYAGPSRYPASWFEADRLMGEGSEKALMLPWHLYIGVPWAQGRVIAHPAPSFFERETIVSLDPEYGSLQAGGPDGRHKYLDFAVRTSRRGRQLGRLIAPLGVKYVLLAQIGDFKNYGWVARQKDLRVVRRWPDLTLFENQAKVHDAFVPTSKLSAENWGDVAGVAQRSPLERFALTVENNEGGRVRRIRIPSAGKETPVRLEQASPVKFRVVDSADDGPLVTSIPFSTGWRYQEPRPQRNLGVSTLFPVTRVEPGTIRYAPWATVRLWYLIGMSISLLALAFLVWERRRFGREGYPNDVPEDRSRSSDVTI